MKFEHTELSGVVLITPRRHGDARGYFMETFRLSLFESEIGAFTFVQDNRSFSAEIGTVRGLHFQLNPRAQGKLVSCAAGALLDVVVDVRAGSPTYGQSFSAELTPENGRQLWVPPGFAHGFCTLKADTVISYKVTDYYSPDHDRGLLWNDPSLAIQWPVTEEKAILSDKDKRQPLLSEVEANFVCSH
ncbi:dTDP-4-dehydrorhamnose 3,5-epimerase [Agrobacterium rosae]|uniref:dTDP-4-dehydrorhamnose 3,5-epimerase n=1 Tax=Agrobacterium rosae TaxID=1972867 RepID=UPI00122F4E7B|nr:dTDP-4-dehydrorhamnose 3,5-epimerase [Agrobacterium rosae]KAA3507681.1 dTDP-4-dehydrorhamnose 3,5-epimerase [Agrobacterium rosae]KAA3512561.1 dTDP-4-dehydrorhamnose 3,5-epimerase [Agrobacterium rosae]MQB51266.1 dTDP-4-dehydrorhamnose 3,5-epimerase [Agrobacterium rosae]